MRHSFIILALLLGVFITGCDDKKQPTAPGQLADDKTILVLNDSITTIFNNFLSANDTTSMLHALELSDILLSLDRTEEGQFFGTTRKAQILNALGKKKEAFALQDKTTNPDPESIDRLVYNGIAAKLKKDENLSNSCFTKAMQKCDQELALNQQKTEVFITKITILLYQDKKNVAIKELNDRLAKDSQNQMLISLKENIDDIYAKLQDFFNN